MSGLFWFLLGMNAGVIIGLLLAVIMIVLFFFFYGHKTKKHVKRYLMEWERKKRKEAGYDG